MAACGEDDSIIWPQKFSFVKYTFDCIPAKPVIPQLFLQTVMPEPLPEEGSVGVTLADDMVGYL